MSDFKFQSNARKIEVNNLNKQREYLIYQRFYRQVKNGQKAVKTSFQTFGRLKLLY